MTFWALYMVGVAWAAYPYPHVRVVQFELS